MQCVDPVSNGHDADPADQSDRALDTERPLSPTDSLPAIVSVVPPPADPAPPSQATASKGSRVARLVRAAAFALACGAVLGGAAPVAGRLSRALFAKLFSQPVPAEECRQPAVVE